MLREDDREVQFWRREGLKHILPPGVGIYDEPFPALAILNELSRFRPTLEVGCGEGRLSPAFGEYVGVDINPAAVERARQLYPRRQFEVVESGAGLKPLGHFSNVLFYSVLLHVPDSVVGSILGAAAESGEDRVIVAEILGRVCRRNGDPPVFNRDLAEYVSLLRPLGFELSGLRAYRYLRYKPDRDNFYFLAFDRR